MGVTIQSDHRFAPHAAGNDDGLQHADAHAEPRREPYRELQREQFPFAWLPEDVRRAFEEALRCYSADLFNAFGLMCRQTATRSTWALQHDPIRKDDKAGHWRDAVEEIVRIGDIDSATAQLIDRLLFGEEADIPIVDATLAAVLLEVVKDVLYQNHVRAAKFHAAMRMRRYFAQEHTEPVSLRRARGATPGA